MPSGLEFRNFAHGRTGNDSVMGDEMTECGVLKWKQDGNCDRSCKQFASKCWAGLKIYGLHLLLAFIGILKGRTDKALEFCRGLELEH